MAAEVERLVRELREKSKDVTSFVANYISFSRLQLLPIEVTGKLYFLAPDRCRSEALINGREIITIRNGDLVQRYLPNKKEIWKYTLSDLPHSEPINYGIADLRDTFFAVDEKNLEYRGTDVQLGILMHVFTGKVKNWIKKGMLDTRKGFSIPYQPKLPEYTIELMVNAETGLLQRIAGIEKSGKTVLQTEYILQSINAPLEGALFAMEEVAAEYKVVELSHILVSALNPDSADEPPSIN
jgi:outer membrane lipoprotein-sorting protein